MPLTPDEKLNSELEIAGLAAQAAMLADRLVGTQPGTVLVATHLITVGNKLVAAATKYAQDVAD